MQARQRSRTERSIQF